MTTETREMKPRELIIQLDGSMKGRITKEGDGILVRGIPVLTPGIWTDSNVCLPLEYTSEVLEKYAASWKLRGLWSRHLGGVPRRAHDKMGEIRNPRYENDAITVDLYYHLLSQDSRDGFALLEGGAVSAFSVEHGGTEVFVSDNTTDPPTHKSRAETLEFYGLAQVERGACPDAKFLELNLKAPTDSGADESEDTDMDEETKKLVEEQTKQLQAMTEKVKVLEAQVAMSKASPPNGDEKDTQIKALEKRVKELEDTPAPKPAIPQNVVELEDSYADIAVVSESDKHGQYTVLTREV